MQSVVVTHFSNETEFIFPAQLEKLHCLMKEQKGFGGTQRGKETGKGVNQGTSKQAVQRRSKKIRTQQQQKSFQPILMQDPISDYNTGYLWLI